MYSRTKKLIVFDFDGVVADSETLANAVLAELMTELGVPMTVEQAMQAFIGKRYEDEIAAISALTGRTVGDCHALDVEGRTIARFRGELRAIEGFRAYFDALGTAKRCIASSSSPARLAACLDILDLTGAFGPHVYSASLVARGKPHPDIFLYAAQQLGVAPSDAIVIEDSANGVRAAVAAGMTAIGLTAASHVPPGHAQELRDAGAHHVAQNYREVDAITRLLVA